MVRQARKKSKTGIYHVMLRGINHQMIFEDEEDSQKFLETLRDYRQLKLLNLLTFMLLVSILGFYIP